MGGKRGYCKVRNFNSYEGANTDYDIYCPRHGWVVGMSAADEHQRMRVQLGDTGVTDVTTTLGQLG